MKKWNLVPACPCAAALLLACAAHDGQLVEERRDAFLARAPERAEAPGRDAWPASGELPDFSGSSGPPGGGADLDAYVAYGLGHSARLRIVVEEWLASTEVAEQVATLPEPRLTYVEMIEEIETRTGPQERRFALSQPFPWPGELGARGRVADARSEALWHAVETERLAVARDIEVAFHDYAFLGRELRVTGELLELLRGLEPVVQSRVRAGAGQEDLLRLQVEIGRLEDEHNGLEERRPALAARLADAMTWRGAAGALPLPELVEPPAKGVDADSLLGRALGANPRLRALERELEASREGVSLARYRRRPTFALGVEYLATGDAIVPGTPGSGDDPLALSLSLSLPVWTSSYGAAKREARHRARASRERIWTEESALRVRIEEEAFRVNDAARRIGLYRESLLPRADEALRLTLASYRTGAASVLDLIDSERALLELDLSYWRACRELLQGRARLRALIGESPTEP